MPLQSPEQTLRTWYCCNGSRGYCVGLESHKGFVMVAGLFGLTTLLAMGASRALQADLVVSKLEAQLSSMRLEDSFGGSRPEPAYRTFLSIDPTMVPDHLLLAVLLAGGTSRDPVQISKELLADTDYDLTRIEDPGAFERVPGVGPSGMARLLAARELNRRIDYLKASAKNRAITEPRQAFEVARTLSRGPNEVLGAIYVDPRRRPIATRILTRGSNSLTLVDPRQIFRNALELRANAVILVHQHPSGDPEPSEQDIEITKRVARVGHDLGISVLDHLVVAGDRYVSLAERGLMPWFSRRSDVLYGRFPMRPDRQHRVTSTASGGGSRFRTRHGVASNASGGGSRFRDDFGYGETSTARIPSHNKRGGLAGVRGETVSWRNPLPSATARTLDPDDLLN